MMIIQKIHQILTQASIQASLQYDYVCTYLFGVGASYATPYTTFILGAFL